MIRILLKVTQRAEGQGLKPRSFTCGVLASTTPLSEFTLKFWVHKGQLFFTPVMTMSPFWVSIITAGFLAMIEGAEVVLKSSDRQRELQILVTRQHYADSLRLR